MTTKTHRFLAGCLLATATLAVAQDAEPAPGPHGGVVRPAGGVKVEVAFDRDGVRVFAADAQGKDVDLREASGRVEVKVEGTREAPTGQLGATSGERGPKHLQARIDGLTRLPEDGTTTAAVTLTGVPGVDGGNASVEVPFRLARLMEFACPMRCVPPTAEPGKCARCRMELVRAPYLYHCPMHPQVTSRNQTDRCWTCEMPLSKRAEAQGAHGGGEHGGGHDGGGGGHGNDQGGAHGDGHGGNGGGGHGGRGHGGDRHGPADRAQPAARRLGEVVSDFSLRDSRGDSIQLAALRRTTERGGQIAVLTFWCTTCHSCREVERTVDEKARAYGARGVRWFMLDSNYTDNAARVTEFLGRNRLGFSVLMDPESEVARYFGATRTTTTAVIDADGRLRYYGGLGGAEAAVRNLLAGEDVAVPESAGGG